MRSLRLLMVFISRRTYPKISVTVPAPTVRETPSRIANRRPLSMATGVINSISEAHIVAGHHHLHAFHEQLRHSGHIRGPEIKLRR